MNQYDLERIQRFLEKVERRGDCWRWKASKHLNGYGLFQTQYAHRASFQLFKGPIPDGLCVCHSCDQPDCVNPAHLWVGTKKDNSNDMARKGRAAQGETHTKAKLTEGQVKEIRDLKGKMAQKDIARLYGVGPPNVRAIWGGKTWKRSQ